MKLILSLIVLIGAVGFVFSLIVGGSYSYIFHILIVLLASLGYYKFQKRAQFIQSIINASKSYRNGAFEQRILRINVDADLKELSNNINILIDNLEAFMREIATSISCTQSGKFYRKAFAQGLKGSFVSNIHTINQALEKIEQNAKDNIKNALAKSLMDMSLGIKMLI